MKKFKVYTQCKGDDNRIGSFLKDDKGYQVTITFNDLINLFNSSVYKQLKSEGKIVS
jgi:hypothetical protein